MITRRGIGFAVVALGVFFVASATRVGWLHVADALLWGVIAFSAIVPHLTVPRLQVHRRALHRRPGPGRVGPVAGDTAPVELTIGNRSAWARYFLSAKQDGTLGGSDRGSQRIFFARLPARDAAAAVRPVECRVRGLHSLGPVVLESRAPFGLFRRRRSHEAPVSMLVYPRWFEMSGVGLLGRSRTDASGKRIARRGAEVIGSRPYVFGDSVRDIHWKNTARSGTPSVKEYDAGVEDAPVIAFDTATSYGEAPESTLEYAVSIAASIGRAICVRGGAVRLAGGTQAGEAMVDWAELMRQLALLESSPAADLPRSLSGLQPGARVIAVVSAMDRTGIRALSERVRHGGETAAVVLEGFQTGDSAATAARMLGSSGATVAVCRKGDIEEAISMIERGEVRPARRRQVELKTAA